MSETRARQICNDAEKWRGRASRWEHIFQFTPLLRAISKPGRNAAAGVGAGAGGGIWGLVASTPWPAAIGGFVAAGVSVVQWLVPEDARNGQQFHLWRRSQYDIIIDEISQRLTEGKTITDDENKAWGERVTRIRGSDYYNPGTWRDDAR